MNLSCAFTMPAAMVKWRTRTGSRRQGTGDGGQFFSRSRKLEGSTCDQEGAVAHHDIRIGLHLAEPLLTRAEPQRAYHSRYSRCIPRIFILIFICARPLFLVDNMKERSCTDKDQYRDSGNASTISRMIRSLWFSSGEQRLCQVQSNPDIMMRDRTLLVTGAALQLA